MSVPCLHFVTWKHILALYTVALKCFRSWLYRGNYTVNEQGRWPVCCIWGVWSEKGLLYYLHSKTFKYQMWKSTSVTLSSFSQTKAQFLPYTQLIKCSVCAVMSLGIKAMSSPFYSLCFKASNCLILCNSLEKDIDLAFKKKKKGCCLCDKNTTIFTAFTCTYLNLPIIDILQ